MMSQPLFSRLCLVLAQPVAASAWPEWTTIMPWIVGFLVGIVPVTLWFLTRRAKHVDDARNGATEVERLFIGGTHELVKYLQGELTRTTEKLTKAESERDRLRADLHELTLVFDSNQAQHRQVLALLAKLKVPLPTDESQGPTA